MEKLFAVFFIFSTVSCMGQQYPASDHFDGSRFRNLDPKAETSKGIGALLKWKFGPAGAVWPDEKLRDLATPDVDRAVENKDLRITFINHATLLIQWKSINILTDPVFSEKLGPLSLLNLKRYRDPGVPFEKLPTIERLELRDRPQYVLPLGLGEYLPKSSKARVTELDWFKSFTDGTRGLEITIVPSQHWSKRSLTDTNKSLWGAVIFKAYGRSVYFAGDTGYSSHFKITHEKLGPVDVALLPIGAYEPRWFMKDSHMNPDDAIQAHLDLRAKRSIGMHFGTFRLTDEGIEAPEIDLRAGLLKSGIPNENFEVPRNGQTFSL